MNSKSIALSILCIVLLFPGMAQAGLFERITGGTVTWRQTPPVPKQDKAEPDQEVAPSSDQTDESLSQEEIPAEESEAGTAAPATDFWRTAPAKAKLIDERFEPILLIRSAFVYTFRDKHTDTDPATGDDVEVDSQKMDPSYFGHRNGFVLENVELGAQGRFNESGLYYKAKFELVPREKNGSPSEEYLKDAYFGWDLFKVFDVRAGRMKTPFSQANLKSTSETLFIYKPNLYALTPKRQLGFRLSAGDPWKVVRLTGGVFNSVKFAAEQMKKTKQLLYAGRVDLDVAQLLDETTAIRSGFSKSGTKDSWLWDFEFTIGGSYATTAEKYLTSVEYRWMGFDARLHLFIFTLEGEYVVNDYYFPNATATGGDDATQGWGWHADFVVHAWPGILDLAFRIDRMQGDDVTHGFARNPDIDDLAPQKKRWLTGGLKVYVMDRVRLDLNYIHREELEGYNYDNDMIVTMIQFDL